MDEAERTAYRLEFYRSARGGCPAREFLEALEERPRMKVAAWLGLLQEKGPALQRPYADVLEGPIRELRVSFGRLEIRLLYFIHSKSIVVTHGFLKKTQQVPEE